MSGSEENEQDVLERERLRWASVRDPEPLTPTFSDRYWSRLARQGWGDALGRPYERVGIGGGLGALVYAILAMLLVVVLLLVLAVTGFFG